MAKAIPYIIIVVVVVVVVAFDIKITFVSIIVTCKNLRDSTVTACVNYKICL